MVPPPPPKTLGGGRKERGGPRLRRPHGEGWRQPASPGTRFTHTTLACTAQAPRRAQGTSQCPFPTPERKGWLAMGYEPPGLWGGHRTGGRHTWRETGAPPRGAAHPFFTQIPPPCPPPAVAGGWSGALTREGSSLGQPGDPRSPVSTAQANLPALGSQLPGLGDLKPMTLERARPLPTGRVTAPWPWPLPGSSKVP